MVGAESLGTIERFGKADDRSRSKADSASY